MKKVLTTLAIICSIGAMAKNQDIYLKDYGILPSRKTNQSPLMQKALEAIAQKYDDDDHLTIYLEPGQYHFHTEGSYKRAYFISNHDQTNPKSVGVVFEDFDHITFDGQGAELLFHGRMLPISIIDSEGVTIKNLSVDFPNPHISQARIISNDPKIGEVVYEMAPWVNYRIENGNLVCYGEGWAHTPVAGIAFEEKTKRLVYNTSDIGVGTTQVEDLGNRRIRSRGWKNDKLIPGTVIAMRTYYRPTPGIFVSESEDLTLNQVSVHYAEGMGLLVQMTEDITLDHFNVSLRGEEDPRYFTTQADATHFSACKGKIKSKNGLYEAMMDDAINVHGTYLKIVKVIDEKTVQASYMHPQAYGFVWGEEGDKVQFVAAKTMEHLPGEYRVASIKPVDRQEIEGAKVFEIKLNKELDFDLSAHTVIGIENLTWTPEVYFANNMIRNNRARGTLFSTPKRTVVEDNYFDHTSGSAILLAGDCNGWFETGACRDIVIKGNYFKNALTNMFQFTNAVISIYPEIPDLANQKDYFHGGKSNSIVIKKNTFDTFDTPLLYAKSVDGIIFKENTVIKNTDYKPLHWNKEPVLFERVTRSKVELEEEQMAK